MKTREELLNWETYRDYLKTEFKRLPDGEQPLYVSKHREEFTVKGSKWKGSMIFFGERGEKQAKRLTSTDSIKFVKGTCQLAGKDITASGIEATLARRAQVMLKKTTLGYKLVGVADGDGADVPDEVRAAVLAGVCDGKAEGYAALEAALGESLEEMHTAFGGQRGLGAVKLILRDVCGGDPKKLKELVDALG